MGLYLARAAAEAALRLAADANNSIRNFPPLAGVAGPVADAGNAASLQQLSLGIHAVIDVGNVVDSVPGMHAYRVFTENGDILLCTRLRQGSVTPLGVTDADTLQPGTRVYLIRHPQLGHGIILGAEPIATLDPRTTMNDYIVQASRCGLLTDVGLQTPLRMGGKVAGGGVLDWSAGAPVDSLDLADFCRTTETGLMLSLDPYMLQLRVNEMCGLWAFYWDALLRIAGTNFQRWTAGSVLESYDDEGEHFWYAGQTPYPWEQTGRLLTAAAVFGVNSAELTQRAKQWLAGVDVTSKTIIPFHRVLEFGGYVGQGKKRLVCAPPPGEQVYRTDMSTTPIGLFEEQTALSGHYSLATATGMTIGKRPVIVVPRKREDIASQHGDKPQNYNASGLFGAGPTHAVRPTLYADDAEHPGQVAAAAADSVGVYTQYASAAYGLHMHDGDYAYPQPDEYAAQLGLAAEDHTDYGILRDEWVLDPPKPVTVKVDHRLGYEAKIWPNNAYLTFLDDGGVVLADGYGAEIRMSGGSIRITAPGDISLEAGRNIIGFAGRDVVLRARKSADITCTDGDFRVKAEGNVQILAANGGGPHGMLLESRGVGRDYNFDAPGEGSRHAGIVLRSVDAPITQWGYSLYQRSVSGGEIVLDADRGSGQLLMHAQTISRYIAATAYDFFGTAGSVVGANIWSQAVNAVAGAMITGKSVYVGGSVLADGGYSSIHGHFASAAAVSNKYVSPLKGVSLSADAGILRDAQQRITDAQATGRKYYYDQLEKAWYATSRAGNDDVIEYGMASLRTDDEYGTSKFVLTEPRWATQMRMANHSLLRWTERPVKFGQTETYPFPGRKASLDGSSYLEPTTILRGESGHAKSRVDLLNVAGLQAAAKQLDGNYPIIG